jgi:hypothetical protein
MAFGRLPYTDLGLYVAWIEAAMGTGQREGSQVYEQKIRTDSGDSQP